MSFKRELLVSFGVQGIGAVAILLATLWLGIGRGPEVQGIFSHIKAEVEFISAFAMFGLPQALFFYAKAGRLGSSTIFHWMLGCALLALLLGAVYAGWSGQTGTIAIALACATSAVVVHGILRTLLLVRERTIWFNISTSLPQILILLGVGIALIWSKISSVNFISLFALSYILIAILAGWRLYLKPIKLSKSPVRWHVVMNYGIANWLTVVFMTGATLLVQRWVEATHGSVALGQFTMGMTLLQIPLTPINYAGPLLLRRWIDSPEKNSHRIIACFVFIALLTLASLMWGVKQVWPDLWLGPKYNGIARIFAILLVAGAAEAVVRVLAVKVNARGAPWIAVGAELSRLTMIVLGWFFSRTQSLEWICFVWVAGVWVAAGIYAMLMRDSLLGSAT